MAFIKDYGTMMSLAGSRTPNPNGSLEEKIAEQWYNRIKREIDTLYVKI